jgi:acyl carrier protein
MLENGNLSNRLLDIVRRHAPGLPAPPESARAANLPDAGLTSMPAVRLMLAIEAAFAIAIPDAELTPNNFATVDAIQGLVERLLAN